MNTRELKQLGNSNADIRKHNMGNWVRLSIPAESGLFAANPDLDHIPIRENLWYVRTGGETLSKKRAAGDCWVVYEPQNQIEVIWYNRLGDCQEVPQDIAEDISEYYAESTGYMDMVPLSDINPQLHSSMPDDRLMPTSGKMKMSLLAATGIPNQQTIPMLQPPRRGQDYYHQPPPPPPPTPFGYNSPPLGYNVNQEIKEKWWWKALKWGGALTGAILGGYVISEEIRK